MSRTTRLVSPPKRLDPAKREGAGMKMHDGELNIGADLAAELVAGQFPELAGLPISPV